MGVKVAIKLTRLTTPLADILAAALTRLVRLHQSKGSCNIPENWTRQVTTLGIERA